MTTGGRGRSQRESSSRQLPLFEAPLRAARLGLAPAAEAWNAVASQLPAGLRLGTSSWSFPGWQGLLYDRAATNTELARDGLAVYARHPLLHAVGLDRTYYAPLDEVEFSREASATPPSFRFVVKGWGDLLRPFAHRHAATATVARALNEAFLDVDAARRYVLNPAATGLGERLGVVLWQFSPLTPAVIRPADPFFQRLDAFLAPLREIAPQALEVRNRELLGRRYVEILARHGLAHSFVVHPTMPSIAEQRAIVPLENQPQVIVRWMLGRGQKYETAKQRYAPFDRLVDPDAGSRAAIVDLAREALRLGKSVIVIANNKAEGSAVLSLLELARAVASLTD